MPYPLEKRLLYPLCEFLIGLKLTPESKGIKRPLTLDLQQFQRVLHNSRPSDRKLNELKTELQGLAADMDGQLLQIPDQSVFENFPEKFRANEPITLVYKRTDLIDYIKDLQVGDSLRTDGQDYNSLNFDPNTHRFRYHGQTLWIRENPRSLPVRLNLCLLLWGHQVCDIDAVSAQDRPSHQAMDIFNEYPEYEIGADVHYDVLYNLIFNRRNVEGPTNDRFRPIRDAITQLNLRFSVKWHIQPFEQGNQIVRVILP